MRNYWLTLCNELMIDNQWGEEIFALVESLYTTPGRYYHTDEHIKEMLDGLDNMFDNLHEDDEEEAKLRNAIIEAYQELTVAIIFHDVIYNTTRHDNERRSADFAWYLLYELSRDGLLDIDLIMDLILTTIDHNPDSAVEKIICDLDLMRLADPWDVFCQNNDDIRAEWIWVPDEDYAAGREGVLRGFLDRDVIFHTPLFYDRYESRARYNLSRSLGDIA